MSNKNKLNKTNMNPTPNKNKQFELKNKANSNIIILSILVLLSFLSFYKLPDKVLLDDGLIFGTMIDGHVPNFNNIMLYPRHLIYNYCGNFFYVILNSITNSFKSGYDALRLMNNIYGLLGAIVFCAFLFYKSKKLYKSIIFSTIFIYSYGYWCRATEGQVYMSSIFWVLLTFCFVQIFIDKYSINKVLIGSVVLTLLAILHHITNFLLIIPIAISYLLMEDRKKGIKYSILYLGATIMGVLIPYALIFKLSSIDSFVSFFKGQGETHLAYTDIGSKFTISYILLIFKKLIFPTIFVTRNKIMSVLSVGVLLVLIYGWWQFIRLKGYKAHKQIPSYIALTLTYASFFYFWYPDTPWFWVIPFMPTVLISFYGWILDDNKKETKWIFAILAIVLFISNNLICGIYFNSQELNNKGLQMAKFIALNTPENSQIVVAGQGSRFNGDRFYLSLLYNRSRISLYDAFLGYNKNEILSGFKNVLTIQDNANSFVYVTNTLMEDQVAEHFNKLFRVTKEDLANFFDNLILIQVAYDDNLNLKLYQVFPKADDKTFSMLIRKYAKSYINNNFQKKAQILFNNIPKQYLKEEDKKIIKALNNNENIPGELLSNQQIQTTQSNIQNEYQIAYNTGVNYLQKALYEQSIIYFKKAIELKPNDLEALNTLGVAYVGKKDFENAVKMFKKVLEIDPNFRGIRENHQRALSSLNKSKR